MAKKWVCRDIERIDVVDTEEQSSGGSLWEKV